MRKPLPLNPDDLYDVYAHIGGAVWQIQAFENTLVHYLALVFKLPPKAAQAEAYSILEQTGKRTLGQLLNELRKYKPLAGQIDKRLKEFLEERNWLIHRSRHETHTDLYKPAKLAKLLRRFEKLANKALDLNKEFYTFLEAETLKRGMSKSEIERIAEKIHDEWIEK
jgi:chorismate mutase